MKEPGQLKDIKDVKCGKCRHYETLIGRIAGHCVKYGYILVGGNRCKECVKGGKE